jgi:ubiquitin C-terminal hydrolase
MEAVQNTTPPKDSLFGLAQDVWMRMGKEDVVRPQELKTKLARVNPMFAGNREHDAHEFCLELLNQIHDELADQEKARAAEEEKPALPTQLFDFRCLLNLKCNQCGYVRQKTEMYRDLSVDFPARTNAGTEAMELDTLFSNHFQEEVVDYACERCSATKATATRQLDSCPTIFAIHVKRFLPDLEKKRVVKKTERVSFAPDFRPVSDGPLYKLSSIVSHLGDSASTGHYVSYAPDGKEWKEFNDSRLRKLEELPRSTASTAYLLFYEQV